jgi:hypothetical protein
MVILKWGKRFLCNNIPISIMEKRAIGYMAVFISIIYYSLFASFIGQGLFGQASLVERYLIVTTLFLMIFFNVFIGSYILGAESRREEGIMDRELYKIERSEAIDEIISHNLNNLNQIALGYLSMLEKEEISDMGKEHLLRSVNTIKNSGSTIETLKRMKKMDNYEIEDINVEKALLELENKYRSRKKITMDVEEDLMIQATPLISDALEMIFSSGKNLKINSSEDSEHTYLLFKGLEMDVDLTLVKMIVESFGNTIIGSDGITIKIPKKK